MKYKSIYFVTDESIKSMDNLREYFINNAEDFITFHYPHGYMPKSSYLEIFHKGKMVFRKDFYRHKGSSNILKQILYFVYYYYILFKYVKRGSVVIVENPIFCMLSSIPRIVKNTKLMYRVGDYYPNNTGFMLFYNTLSIFYIKTLKYVIYISPPLKKIYEEKHEVKPSVNKRIISLGIKRKGERKGGFKQKKIILGFIGVIRNQQGLDLAFEFLKSNNFSRLEIIGSGYKLGYYRDLAKKYKITDKVKFYGYVEDPGEIMFRWDMGIALYDEKADNLSIYCEPTKIKDYLSFGLPVITTRTTYFASELAESHAGIVVDENIKSLEKAIMNIKKNYKSYLKGVDELLVKYEHSSWYDKKFDFIRHKA